MNMFFSLLAQIAASLYYFALHVTGAGTFPPPLSAAAGAAADDRGGRHPPDHAGVQAAV